VEYFIITVLEITAKSVGDRILKISQHFSKLEAWILWHLFLDTVYYTKPDR